MGILRRIGWKFVTGFITIKNSIQFKFVDQFGRKPFTSVQDDKMFLSVNEWCADNTCCTNFGQWPSWQTTHVVQILDNDPRDRQHMLYKFWTMTLVNIEGIMPKEPYLPCVSMAGRALLAGYHRYIVAVLIKLIKFPNKAEYISKSGEPVSEDHLRRQQRFWKTEWVMNNQLPAYSHTWVTVKLHVPLSSDCQYIYIKW